MLTITGLTLLLIIIFVSLDSADAAAKIYFVCSVVGGCIYANAGI